MLTWVGWCYVNGVTGESLNYTSYFRDFNERVSDFQKLLSILGVNAFMLIFTSVPLTSLGLDYEQVQNFVLGSLVIIMSTFIFIAAGFLRHLSRGFRLLHIYVISYLILHLPWPFTAYDRFLMPILPFLLLFLITELEVLIASVRNNLTTTGQVIRKVSATFVSSVLLVVLSLGVFNYVSGIHRSLASKKMYSSRTQEDKEAFHWINAHTDTLDILVSYRDPVYYLYTGHKAIRSFEIKEQAKIVFRDIRASNGGYLILTLSDYDPENQRDSLRIDLLQRSFEALSEQYPQTFVPVFESTNGRTVIYRIKARP